MITVILFSPRPDHVTILNVSAQRNLHFQPSQVQAIPSLHDVRLSKQRPLIFKFSPHVGFARCRVRVEQNLPLSRHCAMSFANLEERIRLGLTTYQYL